MKRSRLFMGLTAAVLLLASCKDVIEEVSPGEAAGSDGAEEYVYMSAEVRLPAGDYLSTRSSTVNPDDGKDGGDDDENNHPSNADPNTEASKEYENTVQTCLLVIADKNDEFRAVSAVNGIKMNTVDGKPGFSATAKFDRRMIKALYESGEKGSLKDEYKGGFHVFAFCNPSDLLTQKMSTIASARLGGAGSVDWTGDGAATYDLADLTGIIRENPMRPGATPTTSNNIWAPGRFMMANASIKTVSLPKKESDWDHHADSETPFNLTGENDSHAGTTTPVDNSNGGAIKVERLAARFDYRDASEVQDEKKITHNIYKVLGLMDSDAGTEDESYNFVNVKLSRIGLVNMAREMYYLKRVSEDGKEYKGENRGIHKWSLLGKEKSEPFNYVVSPNASKKDNDTKVGTVRDENWYNFPLFKVDGINEDGTEVVSYDKSLWSMYNLADVVMGTEMDQWKNNPGDYHIWRYCTENAIPTLNSANNRENPLQDNLFSTGIVFKGKLIAGQWLGKVHKTTDEGTLTEKWIPYMTYNVQRAILASTLGLNLKEGFTESEFNQAKSDAERENPNLKSLVLYDPAKNKNEDGGIKWENLKYSDFSDMTSYPALYLFEGNLYAGFNEAAEYAYYDGSGGTLYQAMSDVMSHYYLNTNDPAWLKLDGVEGEGDGKGGHAGEVQGFVQMANKPAESSGYVQLTVERFAQILGLIDRSSVNVDGGETYYDRNRYGVRWVDTENNTAKETERFKEWLTSGTGSSFHFTLYDVENESDNYGGETSTSQGWGYYCYYFYWNRHNDNGIPGVMAPMEFAVVRNNVYKLAVTKINQLGHPTDPSNDPTPPDPHDDDETSKVYMKVEVEVLPWTVRVNEIQF